MSRSLDSMVQIRRCILNEISDWAGYCGIAASKDEMLDLAKALHNELSDGGAYDPLIPETIDLDDEHYN